jgi:hypothetical protein
MSAKRSAGEWSENEQHLAVQKGAQNLLVIGITARIPNRYGDTYRCIYRNALVRRRSRREGSAIADHQHGAPGAR